MSLSVKTDAVDPVDSRWDTARWFLIALLIGGIFVANIFLPEQSSSIRVLWNLILALIILTIVSFTQKGKQAWAFVKDARIELRKVVWPTRQETIQSTVMIVVVVFVTALFLWGVDSVLLWLIGFITGQRG